MQSIFEFYPTTDFSYEDKLVYLQAVAFCAAADGFSPAEKEVFFVLSDHFGVPRDKATEIADQPRFDKSQFVGKEIFKVFAPCLLRDCTAVSYGDYDLSDEERDVIMELGEELMINQKKITYIINAVLNQMNAIKFWSKAIRVEE
jgi:hypothetical protein